MLTAQALSMLVGILLPILVAVVTTRLTHPGAKAMLLALLSAVSGILGEYLAHPSGFDWRVAGLAWLGTFLVAVATHYGLWKPTGVASYVQTNVGRT